MRIDVVAFSTNGCATALRLRDVLSGEDVRLHCKTSSDTLGIDMIEGSVREWTGRAFSECDAIVFIGATGIAVRHIAPFVRSKDTDPAVVCMDELGRWAIALLSGHIGGCNLLTQRIADSMEAEAIVTTATDLNGKFSVDTFAVRNGMRISSLKIAKDVSARVLDGRFVGFHSDIPVDGDLPDGITPAESGEFGVCVSSDPGKRPFERTLNLVPMDVCTVASIDLKSDEEAILRLARDLRVPSRFYSSGELNSLEGEFTTSQFVRQVTDVDCVCERSAAMAAGGNDFLLRKTAEDGMTVAVCLRQISPRFV